MSVCAEFAEHVWKPGSCKNCFHPRSAHEPAAPASVSHLILEDEDGVTSLSPYSKPTIAVRPTMMNMDPTVDVTTDINMNQERQVSSAGLKKTPDVAPLYIDSNRCHKTLPETFIQNSISGRKDHSSTFSSSPCSPSGFSRDCKIISNMSEGEEDVSMRENGDGVSYRPQDQAVGSSHEKGDSCLYSLTQRYPSTTNRDGINLRSPKEKEQVSLGITRTSPRSGVNRRSKETPDALPSPLMIPDSCHDCLSGMCSNCSSVDLLLRLPSPQSSPNSRKHITANRVEESEPIYAESTKKMRRMQRDGKTEVSEGQRATITVVAAHTEENNRTFYLSSPDSAVSTQWSHCSPTVTKDPFSPAFTWPNAPDNTELISNASAQPKPQSSPPVPPKISIRTPRLGTSSLSQIALPELSFHVVLPPKQTCAPSQEEAEQEKILLKSHSTRSLEGRIDEVDEEFEKGTVQMTDSGRRAGDSINGAAVCECQSGEWSVGRTTPGTNDNKSSSQTQAGVPTNESEHMLTRVLSTSSSLILSRETNSQKEDGPDAVPPPPPPKKHHRVCNRLSGSNMDLDGVSHQGSVENLSEYLRGLRCSADVAADGLHALSDADSCPSPFPSNPLASTPVSLQPPPPLPQKKLVNRTASAPSESGVSLPVRVRPRLPFSGSETNVSCRDAGTCPSSPSGLLCSSGGCLERRQPLRSLTLDDPQCRGQGRLGGHSRGSITSSSSPQLNTLLSVTPGTAPGAGSTLQLQALLSNMDSREGIYSKLGGLYAESLRRLALKCEEHFTSAQRNPLRFDESNWSLFKLTCNKPSCLSGDAVYYAASCASDPRNAYAVKICKSHASDSTQSHLYGLSVQQSFPPHFNLQQDCGHFIACVPQSMLPSEGNPSRTAGVAEQERVVVITQEVPHQSATDFIKEWEAFHQAQPEVYERRICFLLLQLCTGLEHLKAHGVTHRDLCLENLLLVQHRRSSTGDGTHPDPQQRCLPRLLISNFTKAKQRGAADGMVCFDPRLKRDHTRLAPEIVSAAQYRKFDEFQTGILIYELLHQRNPLEAVAVLRQQEYRCEDLPSIPSVSMYSAGLQRLAHLLLEPDPSKRIHIQDAKRVLQGLLWGPRRDLLEQPWMYGGGVQCGAERAVHEGLLNWLDVKRALLMMKFAERSLEPECNAELEDWLCCQYFSTVNPKSLCHTAELMYNLKVSY